MDELSRSFPEGLAYRIVYNPTVFVRESINEVIHTLFEAVGLVVIVVLVFLQTWRASLIPLLAIPVSLVGTVAAMKAFGFSLNMLSLFGLVLAIGIVVDDAIVVVENVERHIAAGLGPVLSAVRPHDRGGDHTVGVQLAHAEPGDVRAPPPARRRRKGLVRTPVGPPPRRVLPRVQPGLRADQPSLWRGRRPPGTPTRPCAHHLCPAARSHRGRVPDHPDGLQIGRAHV